MKLKAINTKNGRPSTSKEATVPGGRNNYSMKKIPDRKNRNTRTL